MSSSSNLVEAQARLESFIQAQGLRHTRQRIHILQAFFEAGTHSSIDELLKVAQSYAPGIGYATIYRTMKLFVEAGIASERQFQDGQTRYEPVAPEEHHDHLICLDCNKIFEFEDDEIEARQRNIADKYGLAVSNHRHEIYGRCQKKATCGNYKPA
jgi:Fur family ferric uptake transcriptional regulator